MARLLSPPQDIDLVGIEPLSGPRSVNAGATTSLGNFVQTTGSPFGLWRFRFLFQMLRGRAFREYRGWVTGLHGGANATRWTFSDPDMLTPYEMGVSDAHPCKTWSEMAGQPWGNGMPWSNGALWGATPPHVPVAVAVDQDGTIISLAGDFWGHSLSIGSYLGFSPFYLGLHIVTEVFEPGRYRIWPPLRKAITPDDFATLRPTLAMRLESEDAASASRGPVMAEGLSVTMVEVLDYNAREYFAD